MSYQASPETLDHLAALVHQARPDWEPMLVRVILQSHAHHVDGNDLAIAALRAAANPDLPKPASIGWRGPHWRGLDTMPPNVAPSRRCNVCGKTEPDCYTQRPGRDDDHAFEPVPA